METKLANFLRLPSCTLLILIWFLGSNLYSQTKITGTVTDSLNNPIVAASVFMNKTTIGTITDGTGSFSLSVPNNGMYELTVSCIGYSSTSQFIEAEGNDIGLKISLTLKLIELGQVVVTGKEKNRLKNVTLFQKLFLGQTEACKLINSEALHFYRDGDTLKAFSIRPLQIINRDLGYVVFYDLTDFAYVSATGFMRFSGNNYFQSLNGRQRDLKKWRKNRLAAYYGSRLHFLRALCTNNLSLEGFDVSPCEQNPETKEYARKSTSGGDGLGILNMGSFKSVYCRDYLMITYMDNHPELERGILGYNPQESRSVIRLNDTLRIYQNGYYDNPYSVTWIGDMANDRLAEMLPYDFDPGSDSQTVITDNQADSPFELYLLSRQQNENEDQLFVHTDRNVCKPGDTLYFQAYIRNAFTGEFETKSALLYSLLFNENRALTDSARFKIENSTASGWLHIPEDAPGGKYRFVAFTSLMQNFDPSGAFLADITVSGRSIKTRDIEVSLDKEYYSPGDTIRAQVTIRDHAGSISAHQVFLSGLSLNYLAPQTARYETDNNGKYSLNLILPDSGFINPVLNITIPGESNSLSGKREIPVPVSTPLYDVTFIPEGGNLVEGVIQKIAFVATNINGQPLMIEGLLKNDSGLTLDTIKSGKYGPGEFSYTAGYGMYIELTNGYGQQKIWPLPEPSKESISISVRQAGDELLTIDIESGRYNGEKFSIVGTMYTNEVFMQELTLEKKSRITLNTNNLPSGICRITLFNSKREPVAERLTYIRKQLKFDIGSTFNDTSNTDIQVTITDEKGNPVEGFFSVAVVDSALGIDPDNFASDIVYSLNLKPFLSDLLPYKYYRDGFQNLTTEDLDLVLLIYGRQTYGWDFEQKTSPARRFNDYNLLKIRLLNSPDKNSAFRSFDLASLQDPAIVHIGPDNSGNLSYPLDSLPRMARTVMLLPGYGGRQKNVEADLSIPVNEEYFASNKFFIPLPLILQNEYSNPPAIYQPALSDKIINIPEIVIHGNQVRKYRDEYEERFKYADVRSASPELLKHSVFLETAIRTLVNVYMVTDNAIYFRGGTSFFGEAVGALIVLDGMPLYSKGWFIVKTLPMDQISSLTILNGNQARVFYGLVASGGVIFIKTNIRNNPVTKWIPQNKDNKVLVPYQLYRADIDFFRPLDPEKDRSYPTLYWNPRVYFKGNKPVTFSIPKSNYRRSISINVNGISTRAQIGSGKSSFIF